MGKAVRWARHWAAGRRPLAGGRALKPKPIRVWHAMGQTAGCQDSGLGCTERLVATQVPSRTNATEMLRSLVVASGTPISCGVPGRAANQNGRNRAKETRRVVISTSVCRMRRGVLP